jgi:hypothetical protein
MKRVCFSVLLFLFVAMVIAFPVRAGDLNKDYFGATKPGAWAEFMLVSPDGTKADYVYQRGADIDGHPTITLSVKIIAGTGKDSKSKTGYILPRGFDFGHEGLNYGRFTEKMTMDYNGNEMVVDDKTVTLIKDQTKNFGGGLTFEGPEVMSGRPRDRYAYAIKISGPNPSVETGKIWMDATVPFGMARQVGKITDASGKVQSEYEMHLTDMGVNQLIAEEAARTVAPKPVATPAAPAQVSLADGYKAGRVGMEIEVVPGSSGRKLKLSLVNKTEKKLTVSVPAGEMQFDADSPVEKLKIANAKAAQMAIEGGEKSEPIVVEQRNVRGVIEGHCSLSVYEGTPLFSGSVTIGNLPK